MGMPRLCGLPDHPQPTFLYAPHDLPEVRSQSRFGSCSSSSSASWMQFRKRARMMQPPRQMPAISPGWRSRSCSCPAARISSPTPRVGHHLGGLQGLPDGVEKGVLPALEANARPRQKLGCPYAPRCLGCAGALTACCGPHVCVLIKEDAPDCLAHAARHCSLGRGDGFLHRLLGPYTVATRHWPQAELVAFEGDEGDRRLAAHAIGDAPPEPAPEAPSALRPHDDEVGVLLPGEADDLVRRLADRHERAEAVLTWRQ